MLKSNEKTVLIIDDTIMNHKILSNILEGEGYSVLEALNGKEGIDIVDNNRVDIILLDLIMPVMDGYEVLGILKQKKLLDRIPVIVLTSNNDPDTLVRCLNAGAFDFLSKPYNAVVLLHKVNSIFKFFDRITMINNLETDHLTGLLNKDAFFTHVENELINSDKEYMLLYFDIVGFRMLNARYGVSMGDKALQYIANILKKYFKQASIIGRIGADTYGLLIEKFDMKSQASVGEFLYNQLLSCPLKGINIKFGIYYVVDRSIAVSTMLDYAKFALEGIKNKYGYYYSIYDDEMSKEAMREHQLSNCMVESLKLGHFIVYLQPKHNTVTEEINGAEALVRWIHPELGFISPGDFIPLFEKNGFVSQLDKYVWEKVCEAINKWINEGIKPVPVSVNVSRADFLALNVPQVMDDLINKYEIDPNLIHIEVTESAYTDNPEQIISMVSILRDMGFKIEMDDFGSGYSSLNMLSELPIDILKLDMKFMANGNEQLKGSKRNILSFIVSLSKWLQLPTIAEGVETKEEVLDLRSMGVDMIQGFYYSKPMPIAEFKEYMISHSIKKYLDKVDYKDVLISSTADSFQQKPLVLVIEDILSNQALMKKILEPNYRIALTNNGKEGYEYILKHKEEISCILLDLLMPVMDGFQLLKILHNDEKLSVIPVIITTETGSNGELRALNLGAHSFVAKPYNPDVLKHHVRKAVEELNFKKFQNEYTTNAGEIYYKAYFDNMTGVLNENGIKKELQKLDFSSSYKILLLDINGLKDINFFKGHDIGDQVICRIAELLRENIPQSYILGRVEGDQFIVVFAPTPNSEELQDKAQLLCNIIEKNKFAGINLSCTASMSDLTSKEELHKVYLELMQNISNLKASNR